MRDKSSIRIKNPTSDGHVVRLKRGQWIEIVINPTQYESLAVEAGSPWLILRDEGLTKEGNRLFRVQPAFEAQDWAEYANAFLGEVWIDSNTAQAKLLVILETENEGRKSIVTVVNPSFWDIRLKPYETLEVILCPADDYAWEWVHSVDAKPERLLTRRASYLFQENYRNFEEIIDCKYGAFPYFYDISGDGHYLQTHQWFRFAGALPLIEANQGKTLIGTMSFTREAKDAAPFPEYGLFIYLDAKAKYRTRYLMEMAHTTPEPIDSTPVEEEHDLWVREVSIRKLDHLPLEHGCRVMNGRTSMVEHYTTNLDWPSAPSLV